MKVLFAAAVVIAASFPASEQAMAHDTHHGKTGVRAQITTFAAGGNSGSGGSGDTGGGGTGTSSGTGPTFSMETKITSPSDAANYWYGKKGQEPWDGSYDTVTVTRTSTHKITVTNDSQPRIVSVYPDAGIYNGGAILPPDWTNANPWTVTLMPMDSKSLTGTATYDAVEGGFAVPRTPQSFTSIVHAVTGISAAWTGGSITISKNSGDIRHGTIDATLTYTVNFNIYKFGHGTGTGQ